MKLTHIHGFILAAILLRAPLGGVLDVDPNYLTFALAMLTSGIALAVELARSRPVGLHDHNDHELRIAGLERDSNVAERVAILENTTVNLGHVYDLNSKILSQGTRIDRILLALEVDSEGGEDGDEKQSEAT
jgi:hypothetical protein